ncbi:MAG: HU family DNA-binding protein [Aquificaceae bacterium]
MTKSQLIESLSEEFEISIEEARMFVEEFLQAIADELISSGRVELRGFGVFRVKSQRGRFVKNPKTGIEYYVNWRLRISFKTSSAFFKKHES